MSFRVLCAALVASTLAVPALAAAQPVQEIELPPSEMAARGHYLMALEAYRSGHFDEAVHEFEEAHRLAPQHGELLFNLFLAQRDAGQTGAAVASLRAYLEAVPDASNAELLRARLATMESQLAAEQQRAAPPTEPPPDVTAADATPVPDATPLPPPAHRDPSPAPWAIVGVGGALAIGAIVTGVLTASTYASIESSCPGATCPAGYDLEEQRSTGRSLALATDVLGAVGGVAMAVGLIWGIVDLTSASESSTASIQCTPLGCRGRF